METTSRVHVFVASGGEMRKMIINPQVVDRNGLQHGQSVGGSDGDPREWWLGGVDRWEERKEGKKMEDE